MNPRTKYLFLILSISFISLLPGNVFGLRPNILFVISDDQSFPHASAYGSKMVSTPAFDRIANHGVLFTHAYVTSPGCSPSRASILTGLYPWQLEEAGSHASSFSTKYTCFPDILLDAGYDIGYTGKGWAPGNWEISGRPYNPAGKEFNTKTLVPPYSGISKIDYTANFKDFLSKRTAGKPFYFWMGTQEPHRPFDDNAWINSGFLLSKALVPGFLPNNETMRKDLMNYAAEITWFDKHLMNCIDELERIGEFENTIIIVTSDNGMAFPYAKANCTDAGIHVPLSICWGKKIRPQQVVQNLVSLVDIAPTILEATGLKPVQKLSGESLLGLLSGKQKSYRRDAVYAGRERHSFSRYNNMGYPMRSIRWGNYLLVRNFHPERWPAGDPKEITENGKLRDAFYDIDDAPSKQFLIDHKSNTDIASYFDLATQKRPEYELYDLKKDIACINNVANERSYAKTLTRMKKMLDNKLIQTKDSRMGNPEVWETYPRLEGRSRVFPENN